MEGVKGGGSSSDKWRESDSYERNIEETKFCNESQKLNKKSSPLPPPKGEFKKKLGMIDD